MGLILLSYNKSIYELKAHPGSFPMTGTPNTGHFPVPFFSLLNITYNLKEVNVKLFVYHIWSCPQNCHYPVDGGIFAQVNSDDAVPLQPS
jgi:hypothetical protein